MEICIRSLEGQYGSKRNVPDINKCFNNKKYPSLDGNFFKILERTVSV